MREFEITLEQIDIDEEIEKINKTENESEELIEVVDEEPIRRRVVPRIPGRKPINKKKSNSSGKMITMNNMFILYSLVSHIMSKSLDDR